MLKRIIQLIARIKGDPALERMLTSSSDLLEDAGLDLMQLAWLSLLIEAELGLQVSRECLRMRNLRSLSRFTQCIAHSCDGQAPSPDSRALRELAVEALGALLEQRMSDAQATCEQVLAIDQGNSLAYSILSCARYPGGSYIEVLSRLHSALKPATYVEIGVAMGFSMARARPPTLCIGIDPAPDTDLEFAADTRIFRMTSEEFFAQYDLPVLLGNRAIDLGFMDGQHLFEATLDDFMRLEPFCSPSGALLLHDCLPLDERTASRTRDTGFWSGDVWRILPTLAHFRPDLHITAVACAPTGLTILRNLDPASGVLGKVREHALAFGLGLEFPQQSTLHKLGIEVIPSEWSRIAPLFVPG